MLISGGGFPPHLIIPDSIVRRITLLYYTGQVLVVSMSPHFPVYQETAANLDKFWSLFT
jgi:hypothetical protein